MPGSDRIVSTLNVAIGNDSDFLSRTDEQAVRIAGIECTQATQYYSLTGQGSGYRPDNSVPLVSKRPLVLRVYVDDSVDDRLPTNWKRLDGRLRYERVGSGGETTTIRSVNGPIASGPLEAIDRNREDDTLNFLIPAVDCQGTLRIKVDLIDPLLANIGDRAVATDGMGGGDAGRIRSIASRTIYARFDPVPPFSVRFVLVNYTGLGLNIPPPSGLSVASDLEYVLRRYPIGRLKFDDCVVCPFNGDLTSSEYSGGWEELMDLLRDVNAGSNSICIGVLPEGVPMGPTKGRGGGGVAAYFLGNGYAMAHEIGHALGRKHAPNPGNETGFSGPEDPDPNYPDYDDYMTGSIGEYGFDMYDNKVYRPDLHLDFMSYQYFYYLADWVSPYTYTGLRNSMIARMSAMAPSRLDAAEPPEQWLHLKFRVDRDGGVQVRPSFVREKVPIPAASFGRTDITCELVDSEGGVLEHHRCTLNNPYQDVKSPHIDFYEVLAFGPKVAGIVFRQNGEVLDTIGVDATDAPSIALAEPEQTDDSLRLRWDGDNIKAYLVEFSADGGATWQTVTLGGAASECKIDAQLLPPGDECQIRVLVTSGINTAGAATKIHSMRAVPRIARIIRPAQGHVLKVGDELTLLGGGFGTGKGLAALEETQWVSDIDGRLGSGNQLSVRMSEGTHTLTLTVPDGLGGEAQAQSTVDVRPVSGC